MLKVKDIILKTNQFLSKLSPDCQETYSTYYKNCFKTNPISWLEKNESAYDEVYEILKNAGSSLDILDIGSGCGSESITFASYNHRVKSIDLSDVRVRTAVERAQLFDFPAPIFSLENIFELDGKFDVIWMNHSFHHVEPRMIFCQHVSSLLKPGGRLIIAEPNGYNPLVQIKMFQKRGTKTILDFTNEDGSRYQYGNERITNHIALKEIMEGNGLKHFSTRFHRVFPNHPSYDEIESIIKKIWVPIFFYTHMLLVFKK